MHVCCPKRLTLVLGVKGAEGVCSKSKLPTTHSHHHHSRHAAAAAAARSTDM